MSSKRKCDNKGPCTPCKERKELEPCIYDSVTPEEEILAEKKERTEAKGTKEQTLADNLPPRSTSSPNPAETTPVDMLTDAPRYEASVPRQAISPPHPSRAPDSGDPRQGPPHLYPDVPIDQAEPAGSSSYAQSLPQRSHQELRSQYFRGNAEPSGSSRQAVGPPHTAAVPEPQSFQENGSGSSVQLGHSGGELKELEPDSGSRQPVVQSASAPATSPLYVRDICMQAGAPRLAPRQNVQDTATRPQTRSMGAQTPPVFLQLGDWQSVREDATIRAPEPDVVPPVRAIRDTQSMPPQMLPRGQPPQGSRPHTIPPQASPPHMVSPGQPPQVSPPRTMPLGRAPEPAIIPPVSAIRDTQSMPPQMLPPGQPPQSSPPAPPRTLSRRTKAADMVHAEDKVPRQTSQQARYVSHASRDPQLQQACPSSNALQQSTPQQYRQTSTSQLQQPYRERGSTSAVQRRPQSQPELTSANPQQQHPSRRIHLDEECDQERDSDSDERPLRSHPLVARSAPANEPQQVPMITLDQAHDKNPPSASGEEQPYAECKPAPAEAHQQEGRPVLDEGHQKKAKPAFVKRVQQECESADPPVSSAAPIQDSPPRYQVQEGKPMTLSSSSSLKRRSSPSFRDEILGAEPPQKSHPGSPSPEARRRWLIQNRKDTNPFIPKSDQRGTRQPATSSSSSPNGRTSPGKAKGQAGAGGTHSSSSSRETNAGPFQAQEPH